MIVGEWVDGSTILASRVMIMIFLITSLQFVPIMSTGGNLVN